MADGDEKSTDFYAVLGLKKECTASELRNAYKKLALRWHPDRCSASGNSNLEDEAKKNFQSIQEAYSVLSDANKRFLYDLGAYDGDDNDENGMGDFLGEMAVKMKETKSSEKGKESFEDLQELFDEMFQSDPDASPPAPSFSSINFHNDNSNENKRACSGLKSQRSSNFDTEAMQIPSFCIGDREKGGKIPRGKEEREGGGTLFGGNHDASGRDLKNKKRISLGLI
ncbi:dnaJ homolog subfamily B member 6-like isoform X2 [Macadamia integrifolia]|uniref:dnaJ homolog subfamily B member 6-like isoform X2 n=1 Tax=Macadamia integrifolia TaxID=60698 RepID=UPI001C5326F5|nr:dnaJ homolog subfamily B member 6-like isoform X2 [Macadamia integrifolia]